MEDRAGTMGASFQPCHMGEFWSKEVDSCSQGSEIFSVAGPPVALLGDYLLSHDTLALGGDDLTDRI